MATIRLIDFKRNVVSFQPRDMKYPQSVGLSKFTQTVPNVVGLTQAAAVTALQAQSLILGQVTLTTGVVTIQNPTAGAKANKFAPVNITLTA
jgi:beta-lactam-binding protein with PASTA domain